MGIAASVFIFGTPPTVSSLNYTVGDPGGGGQTIVITGTNFTGATSVTFGGTSASFSVVNATTINATLPAHAAGVVSVVVTTPGGTGTGTNIFEYYSPAQETSVNGWWRAPYSAPGADPRWTGTASGGSSGTHNLVRDISADVIPTVGTLNSAQFTTASGNGLDTGTGNILSGIASAGAGTIFLLMNPGTAAAPGADALSDPGLAGDDNRLVILGHSTSGYRAGIHDSGGNKSTSFITLAAGWNAVLCKWDGSTLTAQANGTTETTAAGSISGTTGLFLLGKSDGVAFTTYAALEVIVANVAYSATQISKTKAYWNQKYGVGVI